MLIPNPAKHYPLYSAKVLLRDGRIGFMQGEAEAEKLYIAGDEKDIQAVEITMEESNHNVKLVAVWADGGWLDYNAGAFEKVVEAAKAMNDFEAGDWQEPGEILDEPKDEICPQPKAEDEPNEDTVKKSVREIKSGKTRPIRDLINNIDAADNKPEERLEVRSDPAGISKYSGSQEKDKWRKSGPAPSDK